MQRSYRPDVPFTTGNAFSLSAFQGVIDSVRDDVRYLYQEYLSSFSYPYSMKPYFYGYKLADQAYKKFSFSIDTLGVVTPNDCDSLTICLAPFVSAPAASNSIINYAFSSVAFGANSYLIITTNGSSPLGDKYLKDCLIQITRDDTITTPLGSPVDVLVQSISSEVISNSLVARNTISIKFRVGGKISTLSQLISQLNSDSTFTSILNFQAVLGGSPLDISALTTFDTFAMYFSQPLKIEISGSALSTLNSKLSTILSTPYNVSSDVKLYDGSGEYGRKETAVIFAKIPYTVYGSTLQTLELSGEIKNNNTHLTSANDIILSTEMTTSFTSRTAYGDNYTLIPLFMRLNKLFSGIDGTVVSIDDEVSGFFIGNSFTPSTGTYTVELTGTVSHYHDRIKTANNYDYLQISSNNLIGQLNSHKIIDFTDSSMSFGGVVSSSYSFTTNPSPLYGVLINNSDGLKVNFGTYSSFIKNASITLGYSPFLSAGTDISNLLNGLVSDSPTINVYGGTYPVGNNKAAITATYLSGGSSNTDYVNTLAAYACRNTTKSATPNASLLTTTGDVLVLSAVSNDKKSSFLSGGLDPESAWKTYTSYSSLARSQIELTGGDSSTLVDGTITLHTNKLNFILSPVYSSSGSDRLKLEITPSGITSIYSSDYCTGSFSISQEEVSPTRLGSNIYLGSDAFGSGTNTFMNIGDLTSKDVYIGLYKNLSNESAWIRCIQAGQLVISNNSYFPHSKHTGVTLESFDYGSFTIHQTDSSWTYKTYGETGTYSGRQVFYNTSYTDAAYYLQLNDLTVISSDEYGTLSYPSHFSLDMYTNTGTTHNVKYMASPTPTSNQLNGCFITNSSSDISYTFNTYNGTPITDIVKTFPITDSSFTGYNLYTIYNPYDTSNFYFDFSCFITAPVNCNRMGLRIVRVNSLGGGLAGGGTVSDTWSFLITTTAHCIYEGAMHWLEASSSDDLPSFRLTKSGIVTLAAGGQYLFALVGGNNSSGAINYSAMDFTVRKSVGTDGLFDHSLKLIKLT